MKTFSEFLDEAKVLWHATTKDGVVKKAKSPEEAARIRDTYHDHKKHPDYKAPPRKKKPEAVDSYRLANHVAMAVADHYPDTDGWDHVSRHLSKNYPHIRKDHHSDHIDKAVRKHLGAKDYGHYVEKTHKEFDKMHKHVFGPDLNPL